MKKFSLGISLKLSLRDYEDVFRRYKDMIDEIYFSPPFERKFQSRPSISDHFRNKDNVTKLLAILKMAMNNNINLELVINSKLFLNDDDVERCHMWCKENNIVIKSLCTFNHLIKKAKELFGDIKYICSYNQNSRTYKDLENINPLFDEVVLGNNFIRDVKAFEILKLRGFKVRVLLNNGCSHNCNWCSNGHANLCQLTFERNLKHKSFEFLFAIQSVFPFELVEFYEKLNCVDSYKLSSRTQNKDKFFDILKVYLDGYFEKNENCMLAVCLLTYMQRYILKNINNINFDDVFRIKKGFIESSITDRKPIQIINKKVEP